MIRHTNGQFLKSYDRDHLNWLITATIAESSPKTLDLRLLRFNDAWTGSRTTEHHWQSSLFHCRRYWNINWVRSVLRNKPQLKSAIIRIGNANWPVTETNRKHVEILDIIDGMRTANNGDVSTDTKFRNKWFYCERWHEHRNEIKMFLSLWSVQSGRDKPFQGIKRQWQIPEKEGERPLQRKLHVSSNQFHIMLNILNCDRLKLCEAFIFRRLSRCGRLL